VLLGAALLLIGGGAAPARGATSEVTSITVDGTEALDGGYERVFGTISGLVSPREAIDGLPAEGLAYTSGYELIRPADGRRPRLMLVEAENRGSPLLLNALSGKSSATGPPASASYPKSISRVLESEDLAYARVQWQAGISAGVPTAAQGVGEVIVRDFGRYLAADYPRRALIGVSQGAFFVDTFVAEGFNALPGGRRAYAQALTVDGNGNWMAINKLAGSGPQDPYLRPDGRPLSYRRMLRHPSTDPALIDVANYTDFYRLRAGLTSSEPPPRGVHRYDWPSPHQSFTPALVFGGLGCNGGQEIPLNPLRSRPYLRALVHGMARRRLPRSRRFELGRTPETSPSFNGLPGIAVQVPRTDADAQPVGGVRFPELDLPLGRLEPVSIPPAVTTGSTAVCGNSGGYAPLSPEAVAGRYSRAEYLRRYRRGLVALHRGGYLRTADLNGMLDAAAADYSAATTGSGPAAP
jgi:hypothetical protein